MVEYFRNGGFTMWLILFAAIATAALAANRKKDERSNVLFGGAFACIVLGMLGMSLGMVAVSRGVPRFAEPDKGMLVAQGLGELSNNGSFAVIFATLFGVGAIVTRKRDHVAA